MSYRYKRALLSLVGTAGVYAWFVIALLLRRHQSAPFDPIPLFALALTAQATVQVIGRVIIAGTSSDKYDAPDERERTKEQHATKVGYYVLVGGTLCGAATSYIGCTGPQVGHAMLFSVVMAECTRRLMFLIACRRASIAG